MHKGSVLLAFAVAAAVGSAAMAQGGERWLLECRDSDSGRVCDLTVPLPVRLRQGVEPPVVAAWRVINRPVGIDESLAVRIDAKVLPHYRLVGISEQDRRGVTPPRGRRNEFAPDDLREALVAGKDLTVLLVDDATGRQSSARLPAAGFQAARAALMGEVAKGANRR